MLHAVKDLTLGALDLGGASTQITFVPSTGTRIPTNFSLHFPLYGQSIEVYTHSFLCYGINEIIRRYKANLIKVSNCKVCQKYFSDFILIWKT